MRRITAIIFIVAFGGLTSSAQNQSLQYASQYYEIKPDTSFFLAKSVYLKQKDSLSLDRAKSAQILGIMLYQQGAFHKSAAYLLESADIYEKREVLQEYVHSLNWLGAVNQYGKQFELAWQYYDHAFHIANEVGDSSLIAACLGWKGHYYEKISIPDSALVLQKRALHLFELVNDQKGMARIYDNLGSVYEDEGTYDSAYYYFSMSSLLNHRLGNMNSFVVNINNLGDIFRKTEKWNKALIYTDSALRLADRYELVYQKRSAYRDMAKIYSAMGLHEKANEALEAAYDLNARIFEESNARRLTQLQALYEMERKESRILALEREKDQQSFLKMMFVAIIALVLTIAILVVSQQRMRIQKNKQIIKQNKKIHNTRQALTTAELKNALLNEDKLKAELENKALLEKKLREDLVTKSQVLTSHTLQLIRKNNFLENLKDELRQIQKADKKDRGQIVRRIVASINQSFTQDEDWKEFQKVFEQIHPEFYTRLQVRYPELSSSDLRLCALLKLNLNSTDIATILGISLDSLRVSRYRLRKKLKIENGGSLSATLMES